MRRIVLLSMFVFAFFAAKSQEKVKRSYLALSLYAPTPVGEYKSTDIKNDQSGFAKGGFGFGLEGAFMFHPNIGVGGIWAGYANKFNAEVFRDELVKELKGSGFSGTYEIKGSPHAVGVFMVGPNLSLPMKKITLDLKFFVGNMAYKFPKVETTLKYAGVSSNVVIEGEQVSTLGINPGVAARIRLSKRLGLKLGVDYVYGKPNVKGTVTTKTNGVVTSTKKEEFASEVAFVNIGFGLSFQFNKED